MIKICLKRIHVNDGKASKVWFLICKKWKCAYVFPWCWRWILVSEIIVNKVSEVRAKMAGVSSKNKLKMGNAGRYYGAYLIYDVANSCLASLHAKIPPVAVTRTSPPSPVHVQNPRKFILYFLLSSSLFSFSQLTLLSDLSRFSPSTCRGFPHNCGKDFYLSVKIWLLLQVKSCMT